MERKLKLKKVVVEQIGEETHTVEFYIYDMGLAYMVLGLPLDDNLPALEEINEDLRVGDILLNAKINPAEIRGSKNSVIPKKDDKDESTT